MSETRRLERLARRLEPDAEERGRLVAAVVEHANRYLDAIAGSPAYATRPDNRRARLDAPIAEEGIEIAEALGVLERTATRLERA